MAKSSIAIVLALLCGTAGADMNVKDLLAFARANEGRFTTELPTLPVRVSVTALPEPYLFGGTHYDTRVGGMSLQFASSIKGGLLVRDCKFGKPFTGQNAFGAKVAVKQLLCDELAIEDGEGLRVEDGDIPMSPDQYRGIKQHGVTLELDFVIGAGVNNEVVYLHRMREAATRANPVEIVTRKWVVRGKVEGARWIAHKSTAVLATFK